MLICIVKYNVYCVKIPKLIYNFSKRIRVLHDKGLEAWDTALEWYMKELDHKRHILTLTGLKSGVTALVCSMQRFG